MKAISDCERAIVEGWWRSGGQGQRQAKELGGHCLVVSEIGRETAIEISYLFRDFVFAVGTCTYYFPEHRILSLYCGDAGSGAVECKGRAKLMVALYFTFKGDRN